MAKATSERQKKPIDGASAAHGPVASADAPSRLAAFDEVAVSRRVAQERGLDFETAGDLMPRIDPRLAASVSRRFLDHHRALPICVTDGIALVARGADMSTEALPELADALGCTALKFVIVSPADMRRLFMSLDLGQVGVAPVATAAESTLRGEDIGGEVTHLDADLVGLFKAIILDAVADGASDIHLERYGDRVRVRLRIDGNLEDITHFHLSPDQAQGVVNVIKVHAGLDIADRRSPQGGRFSVTVADRTFDLRVQTQPALHGEHVVVRVLPHGAALLTIDDLGFAPDITRAYRRLLQSPSGLLLVVGPTGCGKSTTLYAGLQMLARDATRKVLTIEDPIECALAGIQQSQVLPEIGFTFANAMKHFVREDPDVIMVGEVRDAETALEVLRASQTGHLVLSTLHCNDATDAVQRLLDLGQHPNSVAAELLGVLAQRLAQRNCTVCVEPAPPPQDLIEEVFPDGVPPGRKFSRGRGCIACRGLGTKGRVPVVELLTTGPELRRGISRGGTVDDLRTIALSSGLVPMRDRTLVLVQEGVVPFDELRSLLPPERLAPN